MVLRRRLAPRTPSAAALVPKGARRPLSAWARSEGSAGRLKVRGSLSSF
jgi:hypothetical protein